MEKIEKLEEFNWVSGRDAITIALCNTIIRKQNEIIDHLNSQAQPEEKKTLEQIREEFDKERVKEWDRTAMETYKQATQSTPEQTESDVQEWEKRFDKRYDQYNPINDDGTQVATWCGSDYEDMKSFISELLEEREREVLNSMREWVVEYHKDNWDIRDFDAEIAIGKIIDRELSKLSKKK